MAKSPGLSVGKRDNPCRPPEWSAASSVTGTSLSLRLVFVDAGILLGQHRDVAALDQLRLRDRSSAIDFASADRSRPGARNARLPRLI